MASRRVSEGSTEVPSYDFKSWRGDDNDNNDDNNLNGFNYKFNSYNARQEKSRDNGFNYDFRHQCYKTFWWCNKLAYVSFY